MGIRVGMLPTQEARSLREAKASGFLEPGEMEGPKLFNVVYNLHREEKLTKYRIL